MKFLALSVALAAIACCATGCSLCNLNDPLAGRYPCGYAPPALPNPKLLLAMKYPLLAKLKLCLCNKVCGTPIPPPWPPVFAPAPSAVPCAPPAALPLLQAPPACAPGVDLSAVALLLDLQKGCAPSALAAPPACAPLQPALGQCAY